jgi:hypothetical protein
MTPERVSPVYLYISTRKSQKYVLPFWFFTEGNSVENKAESPGLMSLTSGEPYPAAIWYRGDSNAS